MYAIRSYYGKAYFLSTGESGKTFTHHTWRETATGKHDSRAPGSPSKPICASNSRKKGPEIGSGMAEVGVVRGFPACRAGSVLYGGCRGNRPALLPYLFRGPRTYHGIAET